MLLTMVNLIFKIDSARGHCFASSDGNGRFPGRRREVPAGRVRPTLPRHAHPSQRRNRRREAQQAQAHGVPRER